MSLEKHTDANAHLPDNCNKESINPKKGEIRYADSCDSLTASTAQNKPTGLGGFWHRIKTEGLVQHGGLVSSGFNLASATLGAGTMSIPMATYFSGGLLASIFLIIICASTVYSIYLLIRTLEITGSVTYEDLARKIVGKWFERVTNVLVILFCWGINIVYVIVMGDILGRIFSFDGVPAVLTGIWGRRLLVFLFWAIFMYPLSIMKEINSLRYASMVGVLSTVYLVLSIVIYAGLNKGEISNVPVASFTTAMISEIPVFIFSYACQTNCFEIYSEMKEKNIKNMMISSTVSMAICTGIYIICGLAGVAAFGSVIDGNILNNFINPIKTPFIFVAFFAIAFTVTMAFPICVFPSRDTILQIMKYENVYKTPTKIRIIVASAVSCSALVVGLFVPGIQIMFSLLGGICGSTLCFIWPAIFILRTGEWTRKKVGLGHLIATWLMAAFGVFAAIFGTALSIYSQATA